MKIVVRSPAFMRKRLASRNESVSGACGLKAGLRTDCPGRLHVAARRPETMKIATRVRANFPGAQASLPASFGQLVIAGNLAGKDACAPGKFAWFSRKIASKESWQTGSLPSLFLGDKHAPEYHLHLVITITGLFWSYRYGSGESVFRQMGHHRRRPAQQLRLLARSERRGRQAHGQFPQSQRERAATGRDQDRGRRTHLLA